MDLGAEFYKYFVQPIDERTGYNAINTVVYALIALGAAYLIFRILKKLEITVDERFARSIVPFVVFGSALRVVVDAAILPYNYFTVTPGIYVLVGLMTIGSVLILNYLKRMDLLERVGWILAAIPLWILITQFINFIFAIMILSLAVAGMIFGKWALKRMNVAAGWLGSLVIFSHCLDGGATYVSIDIFSKMNGIAYFEQHVLTNSLAAMFGGFWIFYFVKLAFAIAAVWIVNNEKDIDQDMKVYVLLLLAIFGLAPGIRDLLRLLCGV